MLSGVYVCTEITLHAESEREGDSEAKLGLKCGAQTKNPKVTTPLQFYKNHGNWEVLEGVFGWGIYGVFCEW